MQHFRLAIIGAGAIFRNHAEAVGQMAGLHLIAAADLDGNKREQITMQGLAFYQDYKLMVAQEKPDAVIISLPHHLHKEAAIWCAKQSTHMLIEKPLAITYEDCEEIEKVCNKMDVKIMVAHVQRYFPENKAVKEVIKGGKLGRLLWIQDKRYLPYFVSSRPGWFFEKCKAGGGVFMNLGAHSIDKIQWLTDQKLKPSRCYLKWHLLYRDIESSGLVFMNTDQGTPVTLQFCGENDEYTNETELNFSNGKISLETGLGVRILEQGRWTKLSYPKGDPFMGLYQDFYKLLSNSSECTSALAEAKHIIHTIETIYSLNHI